MMLMIILLHDLITAGTVRFITGRSGVGSVRVRDGFLQPGNPFSEREDPNVLVPS
ncbi:hypothetical protein [Paenibacillus tarimensis]|uniref:hypothetical protein n=1 Tax=Paenibacillus tarimensis TaxID=416012 RepID=UPI001F20F863|nr:hypothetical protein [Paenibacillus tarimensis]MCF2942602.1 hypothetical protein [Paenibacillus tarimensis]